MTSLSVSLVIPLQVRSKLPGERQHEPSHCSPSGFQALRSWCLLQTLVFEVGSARSIIFQQKFGFLHGSRNHLRRENIPGNVHISWSWRCLKLKGSLGFQTKGRLFKAFRASLRAHRGVGTKEKVQDRCQVTLGAVTGDTELAPLTSPLQRAAT